MSNRPPLRKLLTGRSPTNTVVDEPHSPGKEQTPTQTPRDKKGKLAKMMGEDVTGVQIPIDKNAESRRAIMKAGYQIPEYEPQDAIEDLELTKLYELHQNMPDYFSPRFDAESTATAGKHYHLLMDVRQCMFALNENAQLYFALYNAGKREFCSEEYCVRLTPAAVQESGYTVRCLFVDIKAEEINGSDGTVNNLYIVCRVYRMGDLQPPTPTAGSPPSGSMSVKSPSKRELNESKSSSTGSGDLPIRRPYGVAVMPIRSAVMDTIKTRKIYVPSAAKVYQSGKENDFSLLHEQIIQAGETRERASSGSGLTEARNVQGIQYGVLIFETPNVTQFGTKEIPNFNSLTQVPRIGPSEIDDTKRNFLYVTLEAGDYLQGRKTTAKNVMCRMSVRNNNDLESIPLALSRGKGQTSERFKEYMSSVFYHCNSPVWNERICVSFPPGFDHTKHHLYFQFMHVSGTAKKDQLDWFSFSYLPLATETGALINDQLHKPPIYKHSKKELTNQTYQTYDRATLEKRVTKEKFLIRTQLNSTEMSQDTDMNRIIGWRNFAQSELIKSVKSLAGKPKAGVTSLLPTILDSMLDMLTAPEDQFPYSVADNALHIELLSGFVQLTASLGVTSSSKNKNSMVITPSLLTYMDGAKNTHPGAHVCFIRFLRQRLAWSVDDTQVNTNRDNNFRDLSNLLKAIEPVLRIVFRNYQDDTHPNRIKPDKLRQMFVEIFQDLAKLMVKEKPTWRLALQRFVLASFGKIVNVVGDSGVMDTNSLVVATTYFFSKVNSVDTTDGFAILKLQVFEELVKSFPRVVDSDDGGKKRKRRMGKHGDEDPLLNTLEWRRPMLETILNHVQSHINQSINEQLAVVSLLLDCVPFLLPPNPQQEEKSHGPSKIVKGEKEKQADFEKRKKKEEKRAKRKEDRRQEFLVLEESTQEDILPRIFALVPQIISLLYNILQARAGDTLNSAFLATINKDLRRTNVLLDVAVCALALIVTVVNEKGFFDLLTKLRAQSIATERDFLFKLFVVAEHATRQSLFPKYWIMLRLKELKLGIQTIKWTNEYMSEYYLSDAQFDADLWRKFSVLATSVLLASEMNIETLPDGKRHYMEERYFDQRAKIAQQLHRTWSSLDTKQIELIEVLAGPLIDLTQNKKEDVQLMAGTLYFTLCQCEFKATGTFRKVQYHTIDEVGRIVRELAVKESTTDDLKKYRAFFHTDLMGAFSVDEALKAEGATFLKEIDELFDRIMTLESLPPQKKYEDERTSACIDLLAYLKKSSKTLMYEIYVQRLSQIHRELKNCVEWGNALMLHQHTLTWGETWLEGNLELPGQTETQRKIWLFEQAMKAYDEGKAWENSIQVAQQLAQVYENIIYDIPALTRLLRQQADYFDKIIREDRIFNAYYRVVYLGSGIPDNMRGKEYVYRSGDGVAPEGVREFTLRIKEKFPDAQVVNGSDLPPASVLAADDKKTQYIQITTLATSSREELKKEASKWETLAHTPPQRMLKYYQVHNVDHFSYTRVAKEHAAAKKSSAKSNEYRDLWTIKYFLVTKEPLPGSQRRVEVVEKHETLMVPLENAVYTIVSKNNEIKQLCNELKADETGKMSLGPLTMQLSGVIDAAVQGGVEKYREAFFDGTYIADFPDHEPFIPQFKDALSKQLEILRVGLDLFGAKAEDNLRPLHEHLSKTYDQMVADLKNIIT